MEIQQRNLAPAFTTKDGSEIRELLAHRNSGIKNQSLAEATVPPGTRTQRHYHERSEEIYYVLRGCGIMEIDGETRDIGPGDAVAIPPGARHHVANHGLDPLVFLCCCAPAYEHEDTIMVQPYGGD